MNILIVDNGTKHLGRLKVLLFGKNFNVVPLFRKYSDIEGYDLIILSGGSQFSITNVPEVFKEEIQLIKTAKVPIIGICEGCEMIAYAYGSKLEFQERKSKGLRTIIPLKRSHIFEGLEKLEVYEAHHWAITKLGPELIGLAKSRTGFEILKHKKRKIYGLQFHPEMLGDKSSGDEIFKRIVVKLTGESKFEAD